MEHERAAVAGSGAADRVVRKELAVGEVGPGLEMPDVAAPAAVVEGEPHLVDACAGEDHLTEGGGPRPSGNGQRDVTREDVVGLLRVRVRDPGRGGDGERQ
jgi:hypothetical protein